MSRLAALVAVAILATVWPVSGEERSGAAQTDSVIAGTVRDASGGVLPGARVTATGPAVTESVMAVTAADGGFALQVPPGTYRLVIELDGFSPQVEEAVTPGPATRRDIVLALPAYADTLVVTGTRSPEALRATPVAMTVVREGEMERTPAAHYGELLRSTPGVNTIELSARDIQLSTRAATGRNARTTLALLDGRTMYQDYFGMVLWDLLPVAFDEVKQVEVVRGPGSTLWGANALTGVVNILTKSPRELVGTRVRAGIGSVGSREAGLVHGGVRGRLSYTLSGSHYAQDAWDRPETLPDGTPLPAFASQGTTQYKAHARVDLDRGGERRWRVDGGMADSSGVILVAVGPYDARTLRQTYGSVEYSRGPTSVSGFFTAHRSKYAGLLGPDQADISSQLFQVEAKSSRSVGRRHLVVYGASFKHSHFDLSFVPDVHRREEGGAFVTDDLFLTDRLRLSGGLRLDWFDTFGTSLSPRLGVRFDLRPQHTLRATYNRAYVAPSLVESFSSFSSGIAVVLPTGPFVVPTVIRGDAGLAPTTIDAVEVGYTGMIGPATVSASWYRNSTAGLIQLPVSEAYSPADPPANWPLPREALAGLGLPKTFLWSSVGDVDEGGLELSVEAPLRRGVALSGTYTWQGTPEVAAGSTIPINLPPTHRASVRLSADRSRFLGTAAATYTDRAFWTDVLAFRGWTDAFWLLDASAGVRLGGGRITWLVKGTNLAERRVQHHIFGDIIGRRIMTEVRVALPR